jgi:hypothetical protein
LALIAVVAAALPGAFAAEGAAPKGWLLAQRFQIVNIGFSTNRTLAQPRALPELDGIALAHLDLTESTVRAPERAVEAQQEGTHAEAIETSVMLAIDETEVDMRKSAVEYMTAKGSFRGPFSLDPRSPPYNPSGIYGDATGRAPARVRTTSAGPVGGCLADVSFGSRMPGLGRIRVFPSFRYAGGQLEGQLYGWLIEPGRVSPRPKGACEPPGLQRSAKLCEADPYPMTCTTAIGKL